MRPPGGSPAKSGARVYGVSPAASSSSSTASQQPRAEVIEQNLRRRVRAWQGSHDGRFLAGSGEVEADGLSVTRRIELVQSLRQRPVSPVLQRVPDSVRDTRRLEVIVDDPVDLGPSKAAGTEVAQETPVRRRKLQPEHLLGPLDQAFVSRSREIRELAVLQQHLSGGVVVAASSCCLQSFR